VGGVNVVAYMSHYPFSWLVGYFMANGEQKVARQQQSASSGIGMELSWSVESCWGQLLA
jgi:hypothetical protein